MVATTIKEFAEERVEAILDNQISREEFNKISPDFRGITKKYALMLIKNELDGNGDVDFEYIDTLLTCFEEGYEAGKGFPIIGMQS